MTVAPANILFVDDERPILSSLRRLFRPTGHKIHIATSGAEGLALLREHAVDIVVSDMRMPEMGGAEFLAEVATAWPSTVRMLLTGYADLNSAIEAINSGSISRYLTKPWQDTELVMCIEQAIGTQRLLQEKNRLEALTKQQNEKLRVMNESLEDKVAARTREIEKARRELAAANNVLQENYTATIGVFSRMIQSRAGLSSRSLVAEDSRAVGAILGLSTAECEDLYGAALLCDIGKLSLADESVRTPYTCLDANSQRQYHRHPVIAETTLVSLEPLVNAARIVRQHCERVDGTGFPDKINGDDISLAARILAVAKAYADLQDGRIFAEQKTASEAREFLAAHRRTRYDANVVDAFLDWLDDSSRRAQEVRERKLNLSSVRPGMKTSRDLCDENGVLILAKGHRVTGSLLQRLEQLQRVLRERLVVYVEGEKNQ